MINLAINISQIDLEALKNYLKIVYGFRTVNDPSGDTNYVSGFPADLIAKAAIDENGDLVFDRTLVENALHLVKKDENGELIKIDADTVVTEEEAKELKEIALKSSSNTSEDMRCLRNEMYHMKRDMIKAGQLEFDQVYDGFIDPFMEDSEILYDDTTQTVYAYAGYNYTTGGYDDNDIKTGDVTIDNVRDYTEGQYVTLISPDNEAVLVKQITKINPRSGQMTLDFNKITIMNDYPKLASKSYGLYHNGMFLFGQRSSNRIIEGNNVMKAIFKDGVNRQTVADLNQIKNCYGFATTFTVPASLDNTYLRALDLSLSINGSPGSLYIELYKYNSSNIYNENNLVAISNDLPSGRAYSSNDVYTFTLTKKTSDNDEIKDVLLKSGEKYVIAIKSRYTSTNNIWRIGGFTEPCNQDVHQDTFVIKNDGTFDKQEPVNNLVNDIFLGVSCVKTIETAIEYSKRGAYTGKFELEQNKAQRIRISFNPRDLVHLDRFEVTAKGRLKTDDDSDIYVMAEQVSQNILSHTTWANGVESANQIIYDLKFPKEVNEIEFQIIYEDPTLDAVTEDNYEGLFSLVVSTDNGYTE